MRDRILDLRGRLPQISVGLALTKWVEALLLLVLVVQVARLVWAIITPVGMAGEWQARRPAILPADARTLLFRAFDPFTRGQAADASGTQVTGLALQLFGTRINEGSGQGSAIIATPDGLQSSFAAGDAIMPGVVLKSVSYDHVVIDRGGTMETLFLDQSAGVSGADGNAPPTQGGQAPGEGVSAGQPALTPAMIQQDIGFAPRSEGGKVSGVVVSSRGGGGGFMAAGFQPGDIITQVNGRPITSMGDLQSMQGQLQPGARLSLMVERGAATVPVNLILSGR